ncbi:MAG: twin-arginine translocation signal domain-containing protein [Ignavibacteria bacterium]|nr:twin-arginine translocation signal domain-containing protein [Ignavibacteria bacterium]
MSRLSRRQFMKLAGSSVALGALGSAFPSILRNREVVNNLDRFDHVVVLMMENRSFDNILGYLYTPQNPPPRGQSFEGVAYHNLSNPIPQYADSSFMGSVPVYKDSIMNNPNPDPGEEYPHINTALFGSVLPDTNRYIDACDMVSPWNLPSNLPSTYPMNGFVQDYINNFKATQGRMPTYSEYKIIMSCFPPEVVPVISAIAKGFAVADHWHCAVPSQTFCNRSFLNSAQSNGYVTNSCPSYTKWQQNTSETIFERLANRGFSWKLYFDHLDVLPMSLMIHFNALRQFAHSNICSMDAFYDDCENGRLPEYTFIEPRMIFFHNDEHPPAPLVGNSLIFPSSVTPGEKLIHKVYNAIKNSGSAVGNNWQNTLFIITFDEAGGTYDHVQPPGAVPPNSQPGEMGFTFDRLGIRVPAVLVSAYISSGTVINQPLTHTSVIKTLSDKWNLGNLTQRDLNSPSLANIFNSSKPRNPSDWPETKPREEKIQGDKDFFLNKPLNGFQRSFIGLANALAYGTDSLPPGIVTAADGISFLKEAIKILKVSYSC